ncbi:hypothetical protein ACFVTY_06110 [Streptomyces sp. NPDC058067]|uniref:hypothetical protein n=1 Tax=Streptomyces sp. NPDC058067 TaxID=3346324 RepID=UPI0036EAD869
MLDWSHEPFAAPSMPSPDGKPLPQNDTAEAFRAFARDLAAGRRPWTTEAPGFPSGLFDQITGSWDRTRPPAGSGRTALCTCHPKKVAAALPGEWTSVEAAAGWGSWAALRRDH